MRVCVCGCVSYMCVFKCYPQFPISAESKSGRGCILLELGVRPNRPEGSKVQPGAGDRAGEQAPDPDCWRDVQPLTFVIYHGRFNICDR